MPSRNPIPRFLIPALQAVNVLVMAQFGKLKLPIVPFVCLLIQCVFVLMCNRLLLMTSLKLQIVDSELSPPVMPRSPPFPQLGLLTILVLAQVQSLTRS